MHSKKKNLPATVIITVFKIIKQIKIDPFIFKIF